MRYTTFSDIPKIILDRMALTDVNTEAERALVLKTINAVFDAALLAPEQQRVRASGEAMKAWEADMLQWQTRHHVMAGLLTRIAVSLEKIAGIPDNSPEEA